MNQQLLERREMLLQEIVKGRRPKDVAEKMTESTSDLLEREKQISTICRDWRNRRHWMNEIVRLNEGTFLTELIAGMDEAMKKAWLEYGKGRNPSARVGALRTIIMGKTRVGLLLMKAGVIQQAPQQIESTMTIAGMPFALDPELKQAIMEEAERQRREKENASPGEAGPRQE